VQLAKMMRGGNRAVTYWESYLDRKKLYGNKTAEEGLRYAFMVDVMIFEDRVSLQSRSLEVAARVLYGIEKIFEDCKVRADWENANSKDFKAKYEAAAEYDLFHAGEQWAVAADEAVAKDREARAKRAKWLPRSAGPQ